MTWDELLDLDDKALNLAIEAHCTTHQWTPVTSDSALTGVHWMLEHTDVPGILYSTVPHLHHTASWERCMALAWQYRLGVQPFTMNSCWVVQWNEDSVGLVVSTEAEARRAICQLALWQALQGGEHGTVL